MYAEFSYDVAAGALPNDEVLAKILEEFDVKPNGEERLRCYLLSDTLSCEIANLNDFESTNARLTRLRTELEEQFNSYNAEFLENIRASTFGLTFLQAKFLAFRKE